MVRQGIKHMLSDEIFFFQKWIDTVSVDHKLAITSNEPSRQRLPTASWAALGKALPASWGRWVHLSVQHWWSHTKHGVQFRAPWCEKNTDMLGQVCQRDTKMFKGAEYLSHRSGREICDSSDQRRLRANLIHVYKYLLGKCKGDEASSAYWQGERHEILSKRKKKKPKLLLRAVKDYKRLSREPVEDSIFKDIKHLTEHRPVKCAPADPT